VREARYYEQKSDLVHCLLCPQGCRLRDGQAGLCRVRRAEDGKLYSLNYAEVASIALDPVEKKPLYHFFPGSSILSIGSVGCNLSCDFCQNYELSTNQANTETVSPEEIVSIALKAASRHGNIGISYTYSEPIVWFEYVMDVAAKAKDAGLKNVLVTNGEIRPKPLDELLTVVDAMNIDVKAFSSRFYSKVCSGPFETVLQTVENAVGKCHIEVTTLLIPTLNDSDEEIRSLVRWIAQLDETIPLHLSRYFPRHRMGLPPTPLDTMRKAYDIASESLKYVYLGNVGDSRYATTYCLECGQPVIRRSALHGVDIALDAKRCKKCGAEQAVVI
jgi:pyruvate formate lyase activating enzyme